MTVRAETRSFTELGVPDDLVRVLEDQGITSPFPIQALAIPDGLAGRDILGKAKTGSGKTLAFGIPIAARLERAHPNRPRALVLVPTRELATQVAEHLEPLLSARDLHLVTVYGGSSMDRQVSALRRGVELVIATPGRLIDLLERRHLRLDEVTMVAIDEADQMADMGFMPQVRRIMDRVPEAAQVVLFSATLDHQVRELVDRYLRDPVAHEVESATETVETMLHRFIQVHHMDKPRVAAAIARASRRTLVFTRTKVGADRVAAKLRDEGARAEAIHGDLPQQRRERVLARFTSGDLPVLVATNVAARGLDIGGVDVVVHYDPPDDPKTYLHRSGRTARAGEVGLVVTFVEWDQLNEVIAIQRRAGLNEPIVKMFSNDPRLADLAGFEPPRELAPFKGDPRRRRRRRR